MKSNASSKGHALALLLWMIAGMSLMVAAVIHLARDDIGMAELRLNEAKSRAFARGLAYLSARDRALELAAVQFAGGDSRARDEATEQGGQEQNSLEFAKEYEFGDMKGSVEILPAEAFVSLNTATEEELFRLFLVMGGAESDAAYGMAVSVINYRDQPRQAAREIRSYSGFKYREELLAVHGMSRAVYDRVKDFVHVNNTGSLDLGRAPQSLAAIYPGATNGSNQPGIGVQGARVAPSAQVQGQITFESVYRHKAAASRGAQMNAAMIEVSLANGHEAFMRVWIDKAGKRISRVEALSQYADES